MKMHRTYRSHVKTLLMVFALCSTLLFTGCSNADTAGTQARSDLTAEHVRGLYSGMARTDIEDLLGTSDKSLAAHESIEVYSLADGTTALLRYRDDRLMGAYIRDKDNNETPLFGYGNSNMSGVNGINESGSSMTTESSYNNSNDITNQNSMENSNLNNTDSSAQGTFESESR